MKNEFGLTVLSLLLFGCVSYAPVENDEFTFCPAVSEENARRDLRFGQVVSLSEVEFLNGLDHHFIYYEGSPSERAAFCGADVSEEISATYEVAGRSEFPMLYSYYVFIDNAGQVRYVQEQWETQ